MPVTTFVQRWEAVEGRRAFGNPTLRPLIEIVRERTDEDIIVVRERREGVPVWRIGPLVLRRRYEDRWSVLRWVGGCGPWEIEARYVSENRAALFLDGVLTGLHCAQRDRRNLFQPNNEGVNEP